METIESMLVKNGIGFLESTNNTKLLRKVNKLLRARDDSHLFPISGEYNATNRAIKYYSRVIFPSNGSVTLLEYALGIEELVSNYVNYGSPNRR